jgi:FAD/FMN-containing dehydrogenase
MSLDTTSFLHALRAIVGEPHVLTAADGDLSAYLNDWRKRAVGNALAVVRPSDTQQVSDVVRLCAAHRVAIVPQGGNTGLVVGSVPDASGTQVLLSLTRMRTIRSIDAANLTMTVDAGCVLQQVQMAAADAGFYFPLSLAAQGSCTIGGNLATNAGGTQVLRFGNTRDLCLGLEAVTANGDIWHGLSGLRKDNTGYDLKHLLIGSEGSLAVITAATLKLYPQPASKCVAWVAQPSLEAGVALLDLVRARLGDGLTGFEVMGQFALELVAQHFPDKAVPMLGSAPYYTLVEFSSTNAYEAASETLALALGEAFEHDIASDAVVAQTMSQAQQLWAIREHIPLAQSAEGLNIKHDIAVPISRIAAFVAHTDQLLQDALPGVRLVNFGHLGDGNLHYNVQAPAGTDGPAFLRDHETRVNAMVFDSVRAHGGSISAEHGIGKLKAHTLPHYKDATAMAMMKAIKHSLDPLGILNPGSVLAHDADVA